MTNDDRIDRFQRTPRVYVERDEEMISNGFGVAIPSPTYLNGRMTLRRQRDAVSYKRRAATARDQ